MSDAHQNELNATAMGGSELMYMRLEKYADPDRLSHTQVILSRFRGFDESKARHILWCHDLAGDPESHKVFSDPAILQRLDYIVFVSKWQMDSFIAMYSSLRTDAINDKCVVICNCIEPITDRTLVPKDKLNLIYTPTPHRGLDVLIPVFEKLCVDFPDKLHLDVYSSFKLYGWSDRDAQYKSLFDKMATNPNITSHGTVSNDDIRTALLNADLFLYPSIWQETSCLCLIEAMSAKCYCLATDLAAIPETTGGLVPLVRFKSNKAKLENDFYEASRFMIQQIFNLDEESAAHINGTQSLIKAYADTRYNTYGFSAVWNEIL